jgi:hypothetical protein
MAGVVEAKPTTNPDDAVAPTVNGAAPNTWLDNVPKPIVWVVGEMDVTSWALAPATPPPATLAWLVTWLATVWLTFTVTVIAG